MSSSVYYKFKFQKEETRVTFDGTGISVFDLKKEILVANKLENSARDLDLLLFDTAGQGAFRNCVSVNTSHADSPFRSCPFFTSHFSLSSP
jgi:hypothetical protein